MVKAQPSIVETKYMKQALALARGCNRLTIPEDSPDSRYQYRLGYEDGATEGGLDCILGIPRPDDETLRDRYTPRLFGWL